MQANTSPGRSPGTSGSLGASAARSGTRNGENRRGCRCSSSLDPPGWGRVCPPAGFFTRRLAQDWLEAKLTGLRRGVGQRVKTAATFGDATAAWLTYVEHDRKRRPSTIRDYKNAVRQTGEMVRARDAARGDRR